MAFSANEAAFEGFRIVRREPGTIVIWGLLQLVLGVGTVFLMVPAFGPFMQLTQGQASGAAADPTKTLAAFTTLLPFYAIVFPVALITSAVFTCAVYRAVLRPRDKGFGRLRIGADEFRMFLLWLVLGLLFLAGSIGLIVVFVIAGVALAALAKGAGAVAAIIAVCLAYLLMFLLMIWFGVRLSLAGPMTFTQRRLRLFDSWGLTKGRFWSLFGCYLLTFVFSMIIGLVSLTVYGAVSVVASGSISAAAASMFRPDFSSIQAYFSPGRSIYLVFASFVSAVYYAVGAAPAAAAYRALASVNPENRAEVFD